MFLSLILAAAVVAPPSLLTTSIRDSLEASVVRVLPDDGPALSAEIARLLRWRGDVNKEIQRGDTLDVLYELGDGEPTLLAFRFQGAQLNLRAYRFHGADGIDRFYDENGALIEPQLVNPPVPTYVQITEIVQHGRGKRQHKGIDLKAPEGAPIRLPFAATVTRTNWFTRANGNCIEVAYDDGKLARFLHLSRVATGVKAGAKLTANTPLGWVGTTGHSNAPHLHYEIIGTDGNPVEPLNVHGRRAVRLDAASAPAFLNQRDALDRQLKGPVASASMDYSVVCPAFQGEDVLRCQTQ